MNISATLDRHARAAAFTVAALHYGAHVHQVCTHESDHEPWLAWASTCECCGDRKVLSRSWSDVAILAAEVIALRPEPEGVGIRWYAAELELLTISERVAHAASDEGHPLHWLRDLSSSEIMDRWEDAMEIVRHYPVEIEALTAMLRASEMIDGEEVRAWWQEQRVAV